MNTQKSRGRELGMGREIGDHVQPPLVLGGFDLHCRA